MYKILGITVFKTHQSIEYTKLSHFYKIYGGMLCEGIATTPNIKEKIKLLCKGLDERSKETIFRIIHRSRICHFSGDNNLITILTRDEINELRRIHTEFFPNITQIDDDLYHYGGYFLPIEHFEMSVFWHKHSLRDALSKQTLDSMKNRDIIDVGGFIGDSAVIFEREFSDKNIYTFEATTKNYNLMQKTLELNHSSRIVAVNYGLGSKEEELEISIYGGASSLVFNKNSEKEKAKIITLDSYIKDKNIDVGFIKVDIEGFEMEFLKGAKETIMQHKPAMLISIYHQVGDFFDIKPMIDSWNLGYRFKILKPIDFSVSVETALFCEVI